MQAAHSGLNASAGPSQPAGQQAPQGKPSLQGRSPTPELHQFSSSSYRQQPTAAHADESSPLFSQASSPFCSDRARPTDLASETGAPLCEWSAKAGEETASAWPVADSSSRPMRTLSGGVVEFPLTGFEGREATAVICAGGAVGDLNFCDYHATYIDIVAFWQRGLPREKKQVPQGHSADTS